MSRLSMLGANLFSHLVRLPPQCDRAKAAVSRFSLVAHSLKVQVTTTVAMGLDVPPGIRVGFIGAGQMAEAIARGLDKAGLIPADRISASDVNESRKMVFEGFGASVWPANSQVAEHSNVLILAVKPHMVKTILTELRPKLTKHHLVVSIAAGITIERVQSWAGDVRVVRVMPNTPCLVGETAAALSGGASATQEDVDLVKALFTSIGKVHIVDEKLLNAVTGLSGSGPAYVFVAIEALADGGVAAGLPRDVARSLAAQTVLGSAKMVVETGRHPGELKDEVTSAGGTTIAGLHELEKAGFRGALMNAVVAATKRSAELSGS